MANQKNRVEPEVSAPEGQDGPEMDSDRELNIEDIVPGLEEELARQDMSPEQEIAERIVELETERDALKDKWMRAVAEAENVRRRAEREKKDAQAYGGTRLARDLLSVHDNLERAMKAADDETRQIAAAFIEGVELTQRELLNAFAKHKIEQVTPEAGEKFDPNRHQAMFEAPIPGAEPGTVIECMQDGFMIADRLLRPALVGVAKAMPVEEPAVDNGADAEDDASEDTSES